MEHAPVVLGGNVPVVYLNIHGKTLPPNAWHHAKWTEDKVSNGPVVDTGGESNGTGRLFVNEGGRNTSIDGLTAALAGLGYYLVFVGKRTSHNAEKNSSHSVLQYIFGRNLQEDAGLCRLGEELLSELGEWERNSLWNVLAHENPRYLDGYHIDGMSTVAIDINAREVLVLPDGRPVQRWLKDSQGYRVGDAPFVLKPAAYLGVEDGEMCLLVDPEYEAEVAAKDALLAPREEEIRLQLEADAALFVAEDEEDEPLDSHSREWSQVLRDKDQVRGEAFPHP